MVFRCLSLSVVFIIIGIAAGYCGFIPFQHSVAFLAGAVWALLVGIGVLVAWRHSVTERTVLTVSAIGFVCLTTAGAVALGAFLDHGFRIHEVVPMVIPLAVTLGMALFSAHYLAANHSP